jgi:hypothetical protein
VDRKSTADTYERFPRTCVRDNSVVVLRKTSAVVKHSRVLLYQGAVTDVRTTNPMKGIGATVQSGEKEDRLVGGEKPFNQRKQEVDNELKRLDLRAHYR